MIRRVWRWVAFPLVVLAAGGFGWQEYLETKYQAEFDEQLRLARAEGIPTTAAEFWATIKPAKDEENAALIYRQMPEPHGPTNGYVHALMRGPTQDDFDDIDIFFKNNARELELAERAASLPRCRIEPKPIDPVGYAAPEWARMYSSAELLMLRSALFAQQGNPAKSVSDARKVVAITNHMRERSLLGAELTADRLYRTLVQHVEGWAFRSRDQEYVEFLKELIDGYQQPNARRQCLTSMIDALTDLDAREILEAQRNAGEDQPKSTPVSLPYVKLRAKAQLAREIRTAWSALDKPYAERQPIVNAANKRALVALAVFPKAKFFGGGEFVYITDERASHCFLLEAKAAYRALRERRIPESIYTADLRSPYDGKPLTYEFDGRHLILSYRGQKGPKKVFIPPRTDEEKTEALAYSGSTDGSAPNFAKDLLVIERRLQAGKELDVIGTERLAEALASSDKFERAHFRQVAWEAHKKKLVEDSRLIDPLKNAILKVNGLEAVSYLELLDSVYGLTQDASKELWTRRSGLLGPSTETATFSRPERRLISDAIASSNPGDRVLAAHMAMSKKRFNREDLAWVRASLKKALPKTGSKQEKEYWSTVIELIDRRNAL